MTADIFGLFLNLIGAVVLAIAASMRGSLTGGILDTMAAHHDDDSTAHILDKLRRKSRRGKALSIAGFTLLVVGFGLQIICLQFDCFESTCLPR